MPCPVWRLPVLRRLGRAAAALSCLLLGLECGGLPLLVGRAQDASRSGTSSDSAYTALRNLTLGSEAYSVTDFDLKRDAGIFRIHSGTFCFTPPVNGMVTGAVFNGEGVFLLTPPTEGERKNLKLFSKEDEFIERFERLVLRFTDSTYEEIKKAGRAATGSCDPNLLRDSQNTTRHKLHFNLEAHLLGEVLSPAPRPLFYAFIHGKHYEDKEIFEINPNRSSNQVEFWTYGEDKWGDWAAFPITSGALRGSIGKPMRIEHQQLDTTIEKNATLSGKATATVVSLRDGLRVLSFSLLPSLRVESVSSEGHSLSFIQEDKNADGGFAVVLQNPLPSGERVSITTSYGGKEAVSNEGGGNYFPLARANWYPNDPGSSLGEFATYDMIFRIPKGMKMAATGVPIREFNEGNQNVSVWKSEVPQTVAGFSFGRFKEEQTKLSKPEYAIESYANEEAPDWVESLLRANKSNDLAAGLGGAPRDSRELGTMSTVSLNKKALAEGELAVQVYTEYFGASLFKHLQLTQQTACNFGQSWPELVWIPICYYFDTTVRHQLGMDWGDRGYWKVVTPHEVAHQWWGHTVGFHSGRDQWMSEGFAEMSASLYLAVLEKDPKKFIAFWNDERELLLERDAQGFRAIDVGPLTMGYRASNSRTGSGVTRRLIYPKGAYVLHMLRTMMRDPRSGDRHFKEMMQDFVNTYRGKAATTEDFKAMVETHMTPEMDLEGNHKMNWFFNEYVYGTQLPAYRLDYANFDIGPDGDVVLSFKVSQSNVDGSFRMLVPLYIKLDESHIFQLGRARLVGSTSAEQKVPLKGLKTKPRRVLLNYYDDVLASPN